MKPVSGRRMCDLLEQRGWSLIRTKGSHFIYSRAGTRQIVSVHKNNDLKVGTQRNNMRTAGMTEDDL
jgi:predicted RNA binding protein YcfA (HicA-like mRNA interferase family)